MSGNSVLSFPGSIVSGAVGDEKEREPENVEAHRDARRCNDEPCGLQDDVHDSGRRRELAEEREVQRALDLPRLDEAARP